MCSFQLNPGWLWSGQILLGSLERRTGKAVQFRWAWSLDISGSGVGWHWIRGPTRWFLVHNLVELSFTWIDIKMRTEPLLRCLDSRDPEAASTQGLTQAPEEDVIDAAYTL